MTTLQIHRRELIQTLDGLMDRISESEPDCGCEVFEDLAVANRFLWSEWWPSVEECESAQDSERFRALIGAIKVLGSLESVRHVSRRPGSDCETAQVNQKKIGPRG
jgi:quinol monooxygenase YgiN